MKIIEIMKESATLLGLNEDRDIMETFDMETEIEKLAENPNIASLFNLIKYSIRELCTNYIPMVDALSANIMNQKLPLSDLPNFIRIQNIMRNGVLIKFKIINRNIIVEEDGEYEIQYATYPEIRSVFDEIDYLENFSPDVIVLGLCSYYALAHGMFSEFEQMHEQYVEKAESLKNLKIFEMPSRRWE